MQKHPPQAILLRTACHVCHLKINSLFRLFNQPTVENCRHQASVNQTQQAPVTVAFHPVPSRELQALHPKAALPESDEGKILKGVLKRWRGVTVKMCGMSISPKFCFDRTTPFSLCQVSGCAVGAGLSWPTTDVHVY